MMDKNYYIMWTVRTTSVKFKCSGSCGLDIEVLNGGKYYEANDKHFYCSECGKKLESEEAVTVEVFEDEGTIPLKEVLEEKKEPTSDKALSHIEEALSIVKKRRAIYGDPTPNHERIARLWNAFLAESDKGEEILPGEVALMMILVKIARLIETPGHRDSIVDIIGYADCYAKIMEEKE